MKEILGCWFCVVAAGPACADTIAMIGTGNLGSSALGGRFAEVGHTIVYGSRDAVADDVAAVSFARGIGLQALDVGSLRHAGIVEGLHDSRQSAAGGPVNFHFRPERVGDAR
jgi:predicted dinucleotide-binding enzyme